MSSEVIFLSEVSHAIDLKAEMTSGTNFNCKAVVVTKVIQKSILRNQVVRIIDRDDELKNIAGEVPNYNPKNRMKNRPNVPDQQIEQSKSKRQNLKV